jgi:hypothetical protein
MPTLHQVAAALTGRCSLHGGNPASHVCPSSDSVVATTEQGELHTRVRELVDLIRAV